jgi:hypothetical protein
MGASEGEDRSSPEGTTVGAFEGTYSRTLAGYGTPEGTTMGYYEVATGDNTKDTMSASTGAVAMTGWGSASIGTGGHGDVITSGGAVTMTDEDSASIGTGELELGSVADEGTAARLAWIGLEMVGVDYFYDAF